ncbi:hypothetical protein BGX23_005825 [Mortierella sp. AD031]|nr:hypothetical protein BGX23_005825 [Mortierella sp. AD031]
MKTATTTAAGYPAEWDYPYSHHHHNSNSSSDNDSYPYANPNPYEFQLLHLTSLSVCKDVESGAFEALIRLCPNLEELSWMGPHDSDLQSLTMNLLQCCPRVSVLTYSTVETSEPESVYAGLLNSIPSLVDLQIRIPTLEGGEFTRALLRHAGTLEILDLRIVNHSGPSAASSTVQASTTEEEGSESIGGGGGSKTQENLRRILMGCSELTALSIEGAEGMSESLFMFTWACSQRLHRLFLAAALHALSGGGGVGGVGGMMVAADEGQDEHHSEGLLGTDGGEGEDEFVAEAALHGWTVVSSSGPSRRYRRREGSTSSSASGLDGDNGDLEEESVDTGTGSSFAESSLGSSSSSSNTDLLGETGHLQQGSGTTTTTTTATDNSGAIILNGPLFLTMNHNGNDEEEDAIIATTTAYPTPAPATTAAVDVAFRSSSSSQSFFRDMMHRLGDMPRLQSFVLNGVEYSRMPGMISC